jgi:hypothetical protein
MPTLANKVSTNFRGLALAIAEPAFGVLKKTPKAIASAASKTP